MNEVMNDGPSSAGSSLGQAPLSGGTASSGGMAPQRIKAMATVRPRTSPNLNQQGAPPVNRKSADSKMLSKKGMKKEDLDHKLRLLKLKRGLKKRAAVRTLKKG